MDELQREAFLKELHRALAHLYDAKHLRATPLAALLQVGDRFDVSSALRSILTEAIQSLKPPDREPPESRAWLLYESLHCCYIQRLSQQVVADQLAISPRQLRREQHAAIEALADHLWERFGLEARRQHSLPVASPAGAAVAAYHSAGDELAWLKNTPLERPTDLSEALPAVVDLIRPLAEQCRVRLEVKREDELPDLAVHPVAFNQALLNVLSVAITRVPSGSSVCISAGALAWHVQIVVYCALPLSGPRPASADDEANLDMARQLAEVSGGRLAIVEHPQEAFQATLTLPALGRLPVLVIEDNVDTLQLLQRYVSATRYRLLGARNPEEAFHVAQTVSPQIIVLDVMMPQVGGWNVLRALRQHPQTAQTPIIVCTILAQQALALCLGANVFLRKPITRPAFLAALDDQVARIGKGSP